MHALWELDEKFDILTSQTILTTIPQCIHILRPGRNDHHLADDILKCIFLIENFDVSIFISPKFFPKGPLHKKSALV